MSKPPPDPLFVFHDGTGDGKVHIWDLKDNRRLKTNKIGDDACLQLHQTNQGLFVTQEKSGPTTLWQEDASRHWTKKRVIPSSYVGFCKSVLNEYMQLVIPCGEYVLKVVCLKDEKNDGNFVGEEGNSEKNPGFGLEDTERPLGNGSQNNEKTSLSTLGDTTISEELKTIEEKYLCCEKDEKTGEVMALKTLKRVGVLAVYESGELKIWSLDTQECLSSLNLFDEIKDGGSDCPMAIDYDEKCRRGIVGSSSAELIEFTVEIYSYTIRSIETVNAKLVKLRTITMTNAGASCVRIREDGKLFMVGCWDGRIRLYSCESLKLLVVLDSHRKKTVQDLVCSSKVMKSWTSDNIFASGGLDGRLCLWSVY